MVYKLVNELGGVSEHNSIVKNVRADDWTAELAIITSNASLCCRNLYWTEPG